MLQKVQRRRQQKQSLVSKRKSHVNRQEISRSRKHTQSKPNLLGKAHQYQIQIPVANRMCRNIKGKGKTGGYGHWGKDENRQPETRRPDVQRRRDDERGKSMKWVIGCNGATRTKGEERVEIAVAEVVKEREVSDIKWNVERRGARARHLDIRVSTADAARRSKSRKETSKEKETNEGDMAS